nr:M48 family metallopeptidase [Bacteroidota bacterium]
MRKKTGFIAFIALTALSIYILPSCTTVPLSGRQQLNLLPESELVAMSVTSYGDFIREHKVSGNRQQVEMVKRTGNNISKAIAEYLNEQGIGNRIAGYEWEYTLVEEDVPNAWCMPGGKVVVYSGILPYTKTEAGLAVVMGHEIAHAIARHGNERMSQAMLIQTGGLALSAYLQEKPAETQQLFMAAYGIGTTVGISLPYSRSHETEADKLGLIFMAIAGYDPAEAVEFWKRMAASGGQKPPEFLSTHPSDQTRINNLQAFLPEARKYYRKG